MKSEKLEERVPIPEGRTVKIKDHHVYVSGTKGELDRQIRTPRIQLSVEDNHVVFAVAKPTKREKRLINTYRAHLRNMFKGVAEGHTYALKVCSGHFPMTVSFKNNLFEVKNFLGEKVPRSIKIQEEVNVTVQGDQVIVESINKEKAGNTASRIERLTRRPGFDKRVFQDGIYLTNKDGKVLV